MEPFIRHVKLALTMPPQATRERYEHPFLLQTGEFPVYLQEDTPARAAAATNTDAISFAEPSRDVIHIGGERVPGMAIEVPRGKTFRIGRKEDSDIWIPDRSISGRHALLYRDEVTHIVDLGSRNGTFVGNTRIEPSAPHILSPGETVTVATFAFLYVDREGFLQLMETFVERLGGRESGPS